jgi:thiol-disulfide isomerase/thioredoxin
MALRLSRSHIVVLSTLVLVLIGVAIVVYQRVSPQGLFADLQNDLRAIDPAFDAKYTDLSGNVVDIRTYKGKLLIINSWATWMPFSYTELPLLASLKQHYGEQIVILAINRMEDPAFITSFLSTLPPMPELVLLTDSKDTFYQAVGGYAMPETVIYRKDGTIAHHMRGVATEEMLRVSIDALLSLE